MTHVLIRAIIYTRGEANEIFRAQKASDERGLLLTA